jgi:hypothetical protein
MHARDLGAERVRQNLTQSGQQGLDLDRLGAQLVAARKGKEPTRDRAPSPRRVQDHAGETENPRHVAGAPLDQRGGALHRLQDVVEVVGDTARELTQRLHPLGMRRPRLRSLPRGDLLLHTGFKIRIQTAQILRRSALLSDVPHDSDQPPRVSFRTTPDLRSARQQPHRAVGRPDNAELRFISGPRPFQRSLHRGRVVRAVLRVNAGQGRLMGIGRDAVRHAGEGGVFGRHHRDGVVDLQVEGADAGDLVRQAQAVLAQAAKLCLARPHLGCRSGQRGGDAIHLRHAVRHGEGVTPASCLGSPGKRRDTQAQSSAEEHCRAQRQCQREQTEPGGALDRAPHRRVDDLPGHRHRRRSRRHRHPVQRRIHRLPGDPARLDHRRGTG